MITVMMINDDGGVSRRTLFNVLGRHLNVVTEERHESPQRVISEPGLYGMLSEYEAGLLNTTS